MFCPNCGANNSTEQNFCRSCGLNLEQTAASLLEQIPSAESADLLKRERRLEKFGAIAWTGFEMVLLVAVGGIIYAIITGLILSGKNPLVGALLVAFIVFASLLLAYVFLNEDLKERKRKTNPSLGDKLQEKRETAKLLEEKPFVPVTSVTENSTELLPIEMKTRKLE